MPKRRPDNLPRGWLAAALRERTIRAKNTTPEELEASFERIRANLIRLPRGANTVRRRGRY
jgi:hypothetical protein